MLADPAGHLASLLLHGLVFLGMAYAYSQVSLAVRREDWRPVAEGLTFAGMSVVMTVLFDTPYPDGGPGDGAVLPLIIAACFVGAPGTVIALTASLLLRALVEPLGMVHIATDVAMVGITLGAAHWLRRDRWSLPRLALAGGLGWVFGGSVALLFLPGRWGEFGEHGIVSLVYLGGVVLAGWLIEMTMRKELQLLAALEQSSAFVESVNHELRTPLTELLGYVDLLADSESDLTSEERKEFLSGIVRAGTQTSNLVADLVSASRLSIDELEVMRERVPLDLMVQSIGQGHPEWNVEFTPSGRVVMADPQRLGQVVRNLISNAHEHGGGAARIDVSASGGTTLIDVSDDGPGIPPEVEGRVFDLHVTSGGRSGQGAGIGLWLSRNLINRMGGTLRHQREGDRTHFLIELPTAR